MTSNPPPPQPAALPLQHPSSGVVALVMGILGLTALPLIGPVLALVFGYQCRGEVEQHPDRYTDDLGRVGRILGWIGVVLSVLGLLAGLLVVLFLFPLFG